MRFPRLPLSHTAAGVADAEHCEWLWWLFWCVLILP